VKSLKHQKGFIQVEDPPPPPAQAAKTYPLIGCYAIGGISAWAYDTAQGDYIRSGAAMIDQIILGMNSSLIDDTTTPGGRLSRQDIVRKFKEFNPDIQIFDYVALQEKRNDPDPDPGTSAFFLYTGPGPVGASAFWDAHDMGKLKDGALSSDGTDEPFYTAGEAISDGWGRDGDGFKKSTFQATISPYTVNLCANFMPLGLDGKRFPQYHLDNVLGPLNLDPHAISNGGLGFGPQGIGIYIDVIDDHPRSNAIDHNGDGINDEARSQWDAFNTDHVTNSATAVNGGGVHTASGYRGGHRDYFEAIKAAYPGIQVIGNITVWPGQTIVTDAVLPRQVQPEYQRTRGTSIPLLSPTPRQAMIQGGLIEAVSKDGGFPHSGVNADGTLNGLSFPGSTRGWRLVYNEYRWITEMCDEPNFAGCHWSVRCATRIADTPDGRAVLDWVPDPVNSAWHLMRWGLTMALLDNGYYILGPKQASGGSSSGKGPVLFDEFGTINQATTGLTAHWLGEPLEGPVNNPVVGTDDDGIRIREFEFGWSVNNSSKQNPLILPISFLGGAGKVKRINGLQDNGHNTGLPQDTDLTVPKLDGFCLQKV